MSTGRVPGIFDTLPRSVAALRTEAHLAVIEPWFVKSLSIPGDICEFGCFRGTMSIKFACALRSHGVSDKMVYAFDTFEGFQMDDPSGGPLKVGAYADTLDAFEELTRWSRVVPIRPVKGDAREACKLLNRQLSFVWLDIDFDVLMAPVLDTIWPLIEPDTIIGIDDVGRPETPSVLPWVGRLEAQGRLVRLEDHPSSFIRFFRAGKA
jgi:hypothetical protein